MKRFLSVFPTGHSDMLNCYRLSKMKGLPPSFFGLHVFGGMVLFFSDGIVVRNAASTLLNPVSSLFLWEVMALLLCISGVIHGFRVHLCCGSTHESDAQDGGLPDQCVLGSHHSRAPGRHTAILPCQTHSPAHI